MVTLSEASGAWVELLLVGRERVDVTHLNQEWHDEMQQHQEVRISHHLVALWGFDRFVFVFLQCVSDEPHNQEDKDTPEQRTNHCAGNHSISHICTMKRNKAFFNTGVDVHIVRKPWEANYLKHVVISLNPIYNISSHFNYLKHFANMTFHFSFTWNKLVTVQTFYSIHLFFCVMRIVRFVTLMLALD